MFSNQTSRNKIKCIRMHLFFQASDGEHYAFTTLNINVLDENDNPPQFSQQSYQVSVISMTTENVLKISTSVL